MSESNASIDGRTVESMLLDADVLEPAGDGEDLQLRRSLEREWDQEFYRMANPNAERERLRALLGEGLPSAGDEDGTPFEATETDDGFELRRDGSTIGTWPSRTAFRTDLALAGPLAERIDGWADRSIAQRGELLSGTRLFLESCPDCDGDLSFRVTQTASGEEREGAEDASDRQVALLACEECDVVLFVGDDET